MYDDLRKVMLDDEKSKSGKESLINERFDAIKKTYTYI
jgi:hypothetical protein